MRIEQWGVLAVLIVIVAGAVIFLIGLFTSAEIKATQTTQATDIRLERLGKHVYYFHDEKRGVNCWVIYDAGIRGLPTAISCLPDQQ
jgi:hypothetical protein